jgi:hypothetical protein
MLAYKFADGKPVIAVGGSLTNWCMRVKCIRLLKILHSNQLICYLFGGGGAPVYDVSLSFIIPSHDVPIEPAYLRMFNS